MNTGRQIRKLKLGALALFLFSALAFAGLYSPRSIVLPTAAQTPKTTPTPRTARRPAAKAPARRPRYSEFPHNIKAHSIACSSCHKFPSANWKKVRSGDAAFPDITDYPKHASCINCHRQQFFRGSPPAICSICHTNPGPRNSARHPFPNPREIFDKSPKGRTASESDFAIYFPHSIHVDIVSDTGTSGDSFVKASWKGRMRAEESCAVCHQTYQPQGDGADEFVVKPPADAGDAFWLKKGTFKTSPIGHATCFTCHSADSGMKPAPADCATCHKIAPAAPKSDMDPHHPAVKAITDKITLQAWRERDSSATFRHEWFSHAEMSCATCHNVDTMNTAVPETKRVGLSSCSMCHVTATADDGGALNIEMDARKADPAFQCVKCHISFGKLPVPESHVKALAGQ